VQLEGTANPGEAKKPSIRFSKAYHPEFAQAVRFEAWAASFSRVNERGNVWQKYVEGFESVIVSDLDEMETLNADSPVKTLHDDPALALT
jgi:hypothetical protein